MEEAVKWLSYTYLYVRMRKNPLVYGINYHEVQDDPTLMSKRRDIIVDAARRLDRVIAKVFILIVWYLISNTTGQNDSF